MTKQDPVRGDVGRLRWFFWEFRYAMYNMKYPWRATLLIFGIAPVVHSPYGYTLLVYFGFLICGCLDQMNKIKVFEAQMEDWEADPDDPENETKGNFSRRRLTGQNQIVAYRVADLLSKIP
jgi:hypothetical protein